MLGLDFSALTNWLAQICAYPDHDQVVDHDQLLPIDLKLIHDIDHIRAIDGAIRMFQQPPKPLVRPLFDR
jgi:hypothetical protein